MLKSIGRNVLLIILLSVAVGTTPATAQTTHTVNLDGVVFDPADITIAIGDTVHWVWVSGFHNVESGTIVDSADVHDNNFRSGDPIGDVGTTFDLTFDQAFLDINTMPDHVYPYFCLVHAGVDMAGTITVVDCISNDDCDDGTYCNGQETCVAGACQGGTTLDCDDSVDCTIDSCNEDTDSCDHSADDSFCQDDLYCNGADSCDTSSGCVHAGNPCDTGKICVEDTELCIACVQDEDCDDGIECTTDTCDDSNGSCNNDPDDSFCEDNLFCNGADSCHATSGCIHAGSPCTSGEVCGEGTDECVACMTDEDCNDDIDCTIDSCNNNVCDHKAFSSLCEDNLFCTGIEICNKTVGCLSLGNPCSTGVCDEATDLCANCQSDSDCDDSDDCTDDACIIGECEFESIENCGETDDNSTDGTPDDSPDDNSDSPVGQVTPPLCGSFGMIPMFFMVFGLVGVKTKRHRERTR